MTTIWEKKKTKRKKSNESSSSWKIKTVEKRKGEYMTCKKRCLLHQKCLSCVYGTFVCFLSFN